MTMENKELYKASFDGIIKGITAEEDKLVIALDVADLVLTSEHEQDCCENVYADFSVLKYHKDLIGKPIGGLTIKQVTGMGFLLCFADEKIFIPCYNYQNGYYSSRLSLSIGDGKTTTKIDIGECVEYHHD